MPLEEQGYETVGDGRVTTLLAEFPPARARERGAVACKLLLPYHPDRTEAARLQESVARQAVEACKSAGVGLILEPIVYEATGPAFALSVIETARRLALLGPDVLKMQFPAGSPDDGAACRAVTHVSGEVPWVLLGGGADAGTFVAQLGTAVLAGEGGVVAGRPELAAVEVGGPRERQRALQESSGPFLREAARVARTATLATSQARPDL